MNSVKIKELARSEPNSFIDGDWIEAPYITEEGIRLIQTGNIGVGEFKGNNKKYISEKSFRELKCKEVYPNDLLICRLADPIGRAIRVPELNERLITSVDVTIFRVSENYDSDFVLHKINSDKVLAKFQEISGGSTRQRVSRKNLGEVNLEIPHLPYQRKIAKILNTADAVIEKTEAAISKYRAIKQGMMQDLFTRGIDLKTGQLRPAFKDAPQLYKETELGWIPKEWEKGKLGDYIKTNIYGPRFSAKDYSDNGNVRTIRGTDFTKNGEILYEQCPIAKLPSSLVKTHALNHNDVVIVTTADCGLTAVFEKQTWDYIPSAYTVKYRFDSSVNPYFVKYFMATEEANRQVEKYIRKGTIANLPGSDLFRFSFNRPTVKEQEQIIAKIKKVENLIDKEQSNLGKHQSLKKGLMQDLLTGKVEVEV